MNLDLLNVLQRLSSYYVGGMVAMRVKVHRNMFEDDDTQYITLFNIW